MHSLEGKVSTPAGVMGNTEMCKPLKLSVQGCLRFYGAAWKPIAVQAARARCSMELCWAAPAIGASPGRATVHCWSSVRSRVLSMGATMS